MVIVFENIEVLGEGAFGEVTKCKTPTCKKYYNTQKVVAIKRIKNMDDENAQNEVRILSKLKHENIVQYLEHFLAVDKKDLCIVMEYCNDGTLTQYIQSWTGPVPEWNVWRIIIHLSGGLDYLHKQHPPVIHCDLKPDNILCHSDPEGVGIKIGDFGISRILGRKTMAVYYTRQVGGTPIYMAPEALKQEAVTTAADMWYCFINTKLGKC